MIPNEVLLALICSISKSDGASYEIYEPWSLKDVEQPSPKTLILYNSKLYYPASYMEDIEDGQLITFSTRPFIEMNSGSPDVKIKLLYYIYDSTKQYIELNETEKTL